MDSVDVLLAVSELVLEVAWAALVLTIVVGAGRLTWHLGKRGAGRIRRAFS